MKILHYSLGFPPERTGGLVQYSLDLAREQLSLGHNVTIMYPGKVSFLNKKVSLKINERNNIRCVEIVNSLPLPLIGNIGNPSDFMAPTNPIIFEKFLKKEKPDIIHIHTLMGLYAEFVEVAKQLNIKLIFTTHDYFGISPNPKFYINGHDFAEDSEHDIWDYISNVGSSTLKHKLLQTSIYPKARNILKTIKTNKLINLEEHNDFITYQTTMKHHDDFFSLRKYYMSILSNIDIFHFNSYITMRVYKNRLEFKDFKSSVLHVTSQNINSVGTASPQAKKIKTIAFIGPYTVEKGFDKFLEFVSKNQNAYNFVAMGDNRKIPENYIVKNFGKFSREELDRFISNIDLVVIPSAWHETFGLVGLEALSRNIKTITSSKVGLSDLLDDNFIFNDLSQINMINIENKEIKIPKIDDMLQHTTKIIDIYNQRKVSL